MVSMSDRHNGPKSNGLGQFLVHVDLTIRLAMKQLDENSEKVLFVVDSDRKLIGSLTDGDIRRWILSEGSLDVPVCLVCNCSPYSVSEDYDHHDVKQTMLERGIECIPVVDGRSSIVSLLFWRKLFGKHNNKPKRQIDAPVVIMAGGKGTRLDPFTRILPKPLIPINNKPVIEIIIDRFREHGISEFFISLNYKAKIIRAYFEDLAPEYSIRYIEENKPLGTAGSLRMLKGKLYKPFFVSNCDILINSNYEKMLAFHNDSRNDITLVASLKNFHIPYGVCDVEGGRFLSQIREKPEFNFLVNTGMYILNPDVLSLIPGNKLFHITDLIPKVKANNGKVGVFPISEKSWIDVGEWEEYKKAIQQLQWDNFHVRG